MAVVTVTALCGDQPWDAVPRAAGAVSLHVDIKSFGDEDDLLPVPPTSGLLTNRRGFVPFVVSGADVTHPAPEPSEQSFAGLVASGDTHASWSLSATCV